MDYRLEEGKNGRVKIKEELTPARRWSYLVGKNEKSHTAQSRLVPIITDDEHNPTLAQFEEAFNIEKVTKEFFEKYRDLFLRTKEELDELVLRNKRVKDDFVAKGVNTIDFVKKLLGQVVFLYFLQKKGWFGVKRDDDWGTGPKNFLRELFEGKHERYKNFFNDILEPLFYEALARERDDDFYSRFNCKIPFLNGGLFDPINNYDWVHTDILLPNELFSNTIKTKEGDTGNGILDIFDRYNFTVNEDEPLEKEVAVDPEMLGKVFENLLEVKDRKSKGTYYTPREIVHYMCQQSLINYLVTGLEGKVSKEDIETLIKYGEQVGENEAEVQTRGRETDTYSHKLPESIRQNTELIDEKLANIKVCDPAIGSGAFPVGMMIEIIKARNVLSAFIKESNRTVYNFKRECIEKSLYGVDVDPGAIEIAKLRLWLSLVVDEEDIKQIKPLPNLDYKIVCGDSLLGVEKNLLNQNLFNELECLKPFLFNETSPKKKQEYKKQIDDLICQITNGHKEFDFEVYFSEVFHEKKGFDVVIANPPYVRQEGIKEYKPHLQKIGYDVYNSTSDLYTYFYELSYNILAPNRFSCFISSNKWMRAKYGELLRHFFKTKAKVIELIDFGGHKVFENATVDANILLFQKKILDKDYQAFYANIESDFICENIDGYIKEKQKNINQAELSDSGWTLADDKILELKKKIEEIGTPLREWGVKINRGIITGFNEAFIINTSTKERLCMENPKSADIIKPILRGRNIGRYYFQWSGLWIINAHNGYGNTLRINVPKDFPAIWKYLQKINEKNNGLVEKRWDKGVHWTNLRDCAYLENFKKEKIVWADIATIPTFSIVPPNIYMNNTCYMICNAPKWMIGLLNSKLIEWYFPHIASNLSKGGSRYFKQFVEQIPIIKIPKPAQETFITLVDRILAITEDEDYSQNLVKQQQVKVLEHEIDQMVYQLYGLTEKEIRIVEE
jgi:hypothetical protein